MKRLRLRFRFGSGVGLKGSGGVRDGCWKGLWEEERWRERGAGLYPQPQRACSEAVVGTGPVFAFD